MKEKLSQLKLLQAVDQVIDGLDEQRKTLPKQQAELEAELAELEAAANQAAAQHKEVVDLRARRELDQAEENDRVKKYEARLKDIKTNREYQALLREVGFAKKAAGEIDEELKRLREEIDRLAGEVEAARERTQGKREALQQKQREIRELLAEVEASHGAEDKRRQELLGEVPRDLLSRYNLVRKRTNLVVVNVRAGACQGCFMSLPPQLYNQVRRVDTLYTCPNCHRILFYEPQEEPVKV